MSRVAVGAAAVVLCAGAALGQERVVTEVGPVSGPYHVAQSGLRGMPGILYMNNVETGSRYNPGVGGNPAGSGVQPDVIYDDIPIPAERLGGMTSIEVTRVTVGIRRAGTAPATDINLFWATATTGTSLPDTELDGPGTMFGSVSLAARNEAAFITELVTVGDGVTPLFTVPLNMNLVGTNPGDYGTFMIGVQITDTSEGTLNGLRLTSGPDGNANVFWLYDSDLENPERRVGFAAPTLATFYIIVEGNPVPAPGAAALLALGGLAAARRRR